MLLELYLKRDEVVDWVESEKVSIGAADKNVLLDLLRLEVTDRNRAPHRFLLHWHDLVLLLERVQIQHVDFFVWSIAEKQLLSPVLHVQFHYSQTDMLGHLMRELHLDHSPDLLALAPQDELCDLLVAHVRRSVNLRAQISNLRHALRLRDFHSSFFDKRKICSDVLEDAEAWPAGRAVPGHLDVWLAFE